MSDQQKPTNMTAKEIKFWMQIYIAFVPRILDVKSPTFCGLTPAEVADKAVIELRERLDTCQQYETFPTVTSGVTQALRETRHTMNSDCPLCKGMPREISCG